MDIGEVVQETGIPASSLRYYEELGLISSHARKGLRRQYPSAVVETLRFILLAQSAGFSLAEIKELTLPLPQGKASLKRELLQQKSQDIAIQIRRLQAIKKGLDHAAVCPASNHFECPSFLALLRKAGRQTLSINQK
ncbi:MerR family transcriptional regulator [Undibacterium cyanobacteriorum]|uniref:MerR family transcriptional regulator n=1 Tax=Undibacterium cyanobacteriorum TaxID=3073561 RepID=A0ABY9REQ4_9BURK|nr:MerR family transcriptional regulator [Undibacterium sp. 20NA77.5]WMW79664.1 MerR family transcriptional regulator [Undibacterium sp. 20NA77.5]